MPLHALFCFLSLSILLFVASSTSAEELSLQQQQYRQQIEVILDSEPFNEKETRSAWRPKNITEEDDNDVPQWLIDFAEWLESLDGGDGDFSDGIKTMAQLIEFVFWVIFIGIIVYLIYRFRGAIGRGLQIFYKPKVDETPVTIAGLNVSKESLPEDVTHTAKMLWMQQQYRQAVSLLYRASLSHLLHDYDCHLQSSFTEQECLLAAKKLPQLSLVKLMGELTQSWQQLAYAHQVPSEQQFQSHCQQWVRVFSNNNSRGDDER